MSSIPLELITSGREISEPRLDPSGRWLAAVSRARGDAAIVVLDLDGDRLERVLTFAEPPRPGRGLGGGCFSWVPVPGPGPDEPPPVVYVGGDGELWSQHGGRAARITDLGRDVRAPVAFPTPGGTSVAVIVDEAEVHLVDLADRSSRRIDGGGHEFCFDPAVSPDGRSVCWQAWSPPDMPWDGSVRVDVDLETGETTVTGRPGAAIQQPRYSTDGTPVEIDDDSGWLNVRHAGTPLLAEPVEHAGPTWGMGTRTYALSPDGRRCAIARNHHGVGDLVVVDVDGSSVERLGGGWYGALDWAGDRLVAIHSDATSPPAVVLHEMGSGAPGRTASGPVARPVVTSGVSAWSTVELPRPELVEATAPDGWTLHARRYARGEGRMLCWIHGGPTDQWPVEWRPRIAGWWSRGWDVLVVDPRGTTGHGRAHQQALHGAWGRLDVDDTAVLVAHAHERGWAVPSTSVVVGGSSGGLTVLGLLADHPDLVAAGVATYPVSDLHGLADATHRFEAHYTDTLVAPLDGSDESDRRYRELSPIHRAARITSPLLLSHGNDDPVVPVDHSIRLAESIRDGGGSVDLVVLEGEGHGYRDPANVVAEHDRMVGFLERFRDPS